LADEIEQKYGVRPDLIKGRGGVFEVTVGDELVYSKKATGRFPDPGEVEGLLAGKLDAA
jgi:selenoprotein W-related protein